MARADLPVFHSRLINRLDSAERRTFLLRGGNGVIFERVLMAKRCRKRAAEWINLAETAVMAEERRGHLIVAEHYSALAEATERSIKAALEENFSHPKPPFASWIFLDLIICRATVRLGPRRRRKRPPPRR